MERTHGELRTWLTDRLSGDNADRLADVDRRTACQIAAITLSTHARYRIAGQHRADTHFLHLCLLDRLGMALLDQFACLDDDLLTIGRIDDVFCRRAPKHAAANRNDHLSGIDDGLHLDAAFGFAILLNNDAILRNVDQTPGEITRVGGLECRVRKALARAVRRVEVLKHRQPLFKVGDNGRLDDLARRLGHEAAHSGKLLHLRRAAARAGVAHHIDRVDGQLAAVLAVPSYGRDAIHHFLGDLVGALRPSVNDLVVFFKLGDKAIVVLLLKLQHHIVGPRDDLGLRVRDLHVVHAERDARLKGLVKPKRHDLVAEDDRLFLPAVAVDGINHAGDRLFRQ